jgi:FAD/FMN-containing dehydrogenase
MSTQEARPNSTASPKRKRRRLFLALAGLALVPVALVGLPSYYWSRAWLKDRPVSEPLPAGYVDDASRLNRTHVAETWSIPADPAAAEAELRELIRRAREHRLHVAIGGARHSMGGHTITPEGVAIDMLPFNHMELDESRQILHVGAGARWSQIIPYLDARGFSVAVMQSNNDFSVGGSISVNCHGWQQNHAPIASTVESLRLMKADGSIVTCSRRENRELFSLVLGGYGLLGVILEVDLHVVPNERYRAEVEMVAADRYTTRFAEKVNTASDIGMVYGRLCVVPSEKTFLRQAVLTVFRRAPCSAEEIPPLSSPQLGSLKRAVYRAQLGSDMGKELRWRAEKAFGEQITKNYVSRNQLLDEGAAVYQEKNADRTDILHEYFIPTSRVPDFLERAREIIPRHDADLLNVTIRNVCEDHDSFLRYADQDLFAFVMLFNQARTPEADRQMQSLTSELVEAALACGGRYYLPYRLHATNEQFARAYPQAAEFFKRRRRYDPTGMFENQFSRKYGEKAHSADSTGK